MKDLRVEMRKIENEINDFLQTHHVSPTTSFPLKEYKLLNKKLYDLHSEVARKDSMVSRDEGINWYREQVKRLIDYLP